MFVTDAQHYDTHSTDSLYRRGWSVLSKYWFVSD